MIITKTTTQRKLEKLSPACKCSACSIGCQYGSGILDEDDLKNIAKHLNRNVEQFKKEYLEEIEKFHTKRYRPKIIKKESLPFGKCIFFDTKRGCTIHEVKPMECRVASGCNGHGEDINQWVLVNYFVNKNDPQSIREWNAWVKQKKEQNKENIIIQGAKPEELIKDKGKLKQILEYKKVQ